MCAGRPAFLNKLPFPDVPRQPERSDSESEDEGSKPTKRTHVISFGEKGVADGRSEMERKRTSDDLKASSYDWLVDYFKSSACP